MTKLRELKVFILCIFVVAVASFIVMFYYAVKFTRNAKLVVVLHDDTQWNKHLQGISGSKGPRWEKGLTVTQYDVEERLGEIRDQQGNSQHKRSNITKANLASGNQSDQGLCPETSSTLVGRLYVDKSIPKMKDIEKKMSSKFSGWVHKGGRWKPTECKARVQAGNTTFNRGMLLNIGFQEALKFHQYKCFIFHDVDLIPENDGIKYSCPSSPRHLSVAVDTLDYILPYPEIFGGAESFTKEHFELINGFSNTFWGWGGEDDDLYRRISAKALNLTRPSVRLGRYKMIKEFHKSSKRNLYRFANLEDSVQRMDNDGLNTLTYTVEKLTEHRLYTLITVDVTEALLQDRTPIILEESSSTSFDDNTTERSPSIENLGEDDNLFTIN